MKQTRRSFIATVAAAGAALPFSSGVDISNTEAPESKYPLRMFSKPLDSYDFGFMCDCISKSGIDGIDLTVRPGGKVEPADVESKLPLLVSQAKKNNLALDMMVTGILSATDPFTERILKTASSSGIKHYRLGWGAYDYKKGIWETLQSHREEIRGVAALNQKYKIHGGYQNHAGLHIGGPVWDLHEVLLGLPPEFIGCQYDVRHAMVEGTFTWVLGMRLMAPYIKTLAIKDFTWVINEKKKPEPVTVPMGEGMVDWNLFFRTVKELNISGPLTLHIEYPLLAKGEEKLPLLQQQEIIVGKIKKDVDFLKSVMAKNGVS